MSFEESIANYSRSGDFDKVAVLLAEKIMETIPFNNKEDLNIVLIGNYDWRNIKLRKHTGYLGWKLIGSDRPVKMSQPELRESMKNNEKVNFLKDIYDKSQKYLILPMVEKILVIAKSNDTKMYGAEINRQLKMDKIDSLHDSNKNGGWITAELINMMIDQDLVVKESTGVGNRKYVLPGRKFGLEFVPGRFVKPFCKHSKLHEWCEIEIVKYLKNNGLDFELRHEYRIPDKLGYPGYMKIDLSLWDNDRLIGCIEADGEQHDRVVSQFHRNGEIDLQRQQERDRVKDSWILSQCNKSCVRVKTIKQDGTRLNLEEKRNILFTGLNNMFVRK